MNTFDVLAKECKSMPFEEGWKKIWTEVFSLEKILVAVLKPVEESDKNEPLLFLGTMNDASCVFAFTDNEHFEVFQNHIIEQGDDRDIVSRELSIQEFLNFTHHMSIQNIPFVMMNFVNEYSFHANTKDVLSMYNIYIKNDYMQEQHVEPGTMISVAVPDEIEMIKKDIEKLRGNYKNVVNNISPLLVKNGERINLTFVMEFKTGLPVAIKKNIMQNIHKELASSPLFQTQIHFTEDQRIIPQQIKNVVQVKF